MSYTIPPAAGAPRVRPGVVTAASYLLYFVAALQVIGAAVALSSLGAVQEGTRAAYQDFPALRDSADAIAAVGVGVGVVFALLFAAGFATLGILDGKGKNPARIVTWVVAGIGICCFGAGAAGRAVNSAFAGMGGDPEGPDPAEVQRTVDAALPSWYYPATTTINVLALLSVIAVIILLALPASNAYFRRPEPTWPQPPYPQPPYPQVG